MQNYYDHSWSTHSGVGCTRCGRDCWDGSSQCAICGNRYGTNWCSCISEDGARELWQRQMKDYASRFDLACTEIKAVVLTSTTLTPCVIDIIVSFVVVQRTPLEFPYERDKPVCVWCQEQPTHLHPARTLPIGEAELFRYYARKHNMSPESVLREYQRDLRVSEAMGDD